MHGSRMFGAVVMASIAVAVAPTYVRAETTVETVNASLTLRDKVDSEEAKGAVDEALPTDDLPYQSDAPTINRSFLLRSFLLYGGAYQKVDLAQGVCVGQCAVANTLTGDCTCPGGYTPVVSARILIDVTGNTCGSFLYVCAR